VDPKIEGISAFRSEPFHGRENNSEFRSVEQKMEVTSQHSVPNPSAEEKTTRNSVPWIKNKSSLSEFRSEPFRGRETTRASVPWKKRGKARNAIPNHSVEEETTQNNARLLRVHHRIYSLSPLPLPPSPVLSTCNNFFVAEQLDSFGFPSDIQN
jgi:hypothetical protein